jgi:hypothetical protein
MLATTLHATATDNLYGEVSASPTGSTALFRQLTGCSPA